MKKVIEYIWSKLFLLYIFSNRLYKYDKRGIKVNPIYQPANGCWTLSAYRKKTKVESEGEGDWEMIRIAHPHSYYTRKEADLTALTLCARVCEEFNY